MNLELPSSPLLVTLFAESPWTIVFPMLTIAAALAWWGARTDRVRAILAGVAMMFCAAAILALAAVQVSPGEHAQVTVRALVAAAESADLPRLRACFAPDASMHYGGPESPGDDLERLMHAAESLSGKHRIESNTITEFSIATKDASTGIVMLGCRTTTASSYGAVPTRWWIEVRRQANGEWLIDHLAWIELLNQVPARGVL
ncbi:MAG: hypothetical protein WCO75_11425 [Planctomycetota bacterium]